MDALLGPDEIRFRESFRSWVREELGAPVGPRGPGTDYPPEFIPRLASRSEVSGLFSPAAESRPPALESALILEEVASAAPATGFRLAEHVGLCIPFLIAFGRPEQKDRYLPALAAGRTTGRWLWMEPGAAATPFEQAEAGPATVVMLAAVGGGASDGACQAFIYDERDLPLAAGSGAGSPWPETCRLDIGSQGLSAVRAAVRSSSTLLLGSFLGAAAGIVEACYNTARTRGAFETVILGARDIQVRLSEARVGLEMLRWLSVRAALRRTPGPSAEESDRLLGETLALLSRELDLAGRLDVPGWGPEPAPGARRARRLIASLGRIFLKGEGHETRRLLPPDD